MKSRSLVKQQPPAPQISVTVVLATMLFVWSANGCGPAAGKSGSGKTLQLPARQTVFVPVVPTVLVRSNDFVESIELPGASVRGMQSIPLYAKVGGFVKEIRRVGRVRLAGRLVQISDTLDASTGKVHHIEFRLLTASPAAALSGERGKTSQRGKTSAGSASSAADSPPPIIRATTPEELRRKWPQLAAAYRRCSLMEIDVGSFVTAGTLLAVLDIPEMDDSLKIQQAAVDKARSMVEEKTAAIRSAQAQKALKTAEWEAAKKKRAEVSARLQRDEKKLVRIRNLVQDGSVDRKVQEEVEYEVAASQAALASAEQQIRSAREAVKAAEAAVEQTQAEQKVAEARVKEATAELNRLRTLLSYAEIRAPFSGTITRRLIDHGSFVRPAQQNSGATPLFGITQTDRVRILIPVPGRKSFKIEPGQQAVFHTIGGLPGVTVVGTITRSAATLDPQSRTLHVEMHLSNPAKDARLIRKGRQWVPRNAPSAKEADPVPVEIRPGMFGTVTVRKQWRQLRQIPATALGEDGNQPFVMEVVRGTDGEHRVIKRYVTVIYKDVRTVGLSDGIARGATIVAANVDELKDGQIVDLKPSKNK